MGPLDLAGGFELLLALNKMNFRQGGKGEEQHCSIAALQQWQQWRQAQGSRGSGSVGAGAQMG